MPEDEKTAIEAFVDEVYEKIEISTGTDFMNNEGAALYRWIAPQPLWAQWEVENEFTYTALNHESFPVILTDTPSPLAHPRLQSACNHSCDPNAEVTFPENNDALALVALRDIEDGEEICISYLEECQRTRSRHSRQKQLRENYVFICECEKCEEEKDEPDVTSDEEEEEDEEDEEEEDMEA